MNGPLLTEAAPAGRLPVGWNWRGWAGSNARAEEWRAGVAFTTEAMRAYMGQRLETAPDRLGRDIPQDVADRLAEWIQDANPYNLAEWLEKRGGWQQDGLASAAEAGFAAAAQGIQRRFYLARLTAAAARNSNAAALLKDADRLTLVLDRLASPDKPLTRDPMPFKVPGAGLALFMAFPCLKTGDPVPDFCRVQPNIAVRGPLPDPVPAHWTVEPLLGLDVLKGLISLGEWGLLWAFVSNADGERWLRVLAWAWLDERLDKALALHEQTQALQPMKPRIVKHGGRDWAQLPKVAAGMSWIFGGTAVPLQSVQLDGHDFMPAPNLSSVIVPPAYALLPADHAKTPHQALLPLDLLGGEDDAPPLAVALAGATQYALIPAGGKIGLQILVSSFRNQSGIAQTTLRELTKRINPGARLNKEHYQTASRGLWQLANLRLFMPNGWADSVFYIPRAPWKDLTPDQYDTPITVGLDPTFGQTMQQISGSYRGFFLVDLTGAMELPTKRASLLRVLVRTSAFWNAYFGQGGAPDPGRIPSTPAERWAAMTNALPQSAVDYLKAKGQHKGSGVVRLSEAIRDAIRDAEDLEARGLVVIDKASSKAFRLLPPDIYLEAWAKAKRGGGR